MQRLWLIFAQTVTVCLGILFIVTTLRPQWLQADRPAAVMPPAVAPAVGARPENLVQSYAAAVGRAAPAVVNVYTAKHVDIPLMPLPTDPGLNQLLRQMPGFTRRQTKTSLGSGVIVRAEGYILTNYHVIEAADAIEVALRDGRKAGARMVGADPESDLAVLKIDLDKLPSISFNSDHQVQVGDVVLAIGNPFGVGQTTTMGIVSALGRNRLGINIYENFIQTDAAINPGNSGGALVDTAGELVGINTAIYSESGGSLGIGFAIPAAAAHQIMDQIIEHGTVTRGWLGIEPQDITPDLARAFRLKSDDGVIIARVLRDGPAARAGVRVGDIVRTLNGDAVADSVDMLNQIAPLKQGDTAELGLQRDGQSLTVNIKVGVRPPIQRQ
jgi:serine protease DegQ